TVGTIRNRSLRHDDVRLGALRIRPKRVEICGSHDLSPLTAGCSPVLRGEPDELSAAQLRAFWRGLATGAAGTHVCTAAGEASNRRGPTSVAGRSAFARRC